MRVQNTSIDFHSGFTLIELLLAIAIIGVLASIVIVAVDPIKQFNDAFGATGKSQANQLEKAIQQYIIDNGAEPSALTGNPQTVCSPGTTDASCISLDADLSPTYISEIPQVGDFTPPDSGLEAYIDGSFVQVESKNTVITDGLIARWTFDSNADDAIGSNNGTLTNGAALVGSKPTVTIANANVLQLDGDDDFVELGSIDSNNPLMLNGTDVTFSVWVNQDSGGDDYQRIIDKSSGSTGTNGYGVYIRPASRTVNLTIDGATVYTFGAAYALSTWQHIAVTYDATSLETNFYVNGLLARTQTHTRSIPVATTNARIGTWNHTTAREFDGMIDDLRVYNKILSTSDIATIAAGKG